MTGKILFMALLALGLSGMANEAFSAVNRSGNNFRLSGSLTDQDIAQIKAEMGNIDQKKLGFVLQDTKDADLARLCETFPAMDALNIQTSNALTSIAPMAALKNLREFKLRANNVRDFGPLSTLTSMVTLDLTSEAMGPDLKWMSGMTGLDSLTISAGSELKSFEGIPSLPALSKASFSHAAPVDLKPLLALSGLDSLTLSYCTLGDLTPLVSLPKLADLSLYASTLKDFSPLAQCATLKNLTYYAVKGADFSTLGKLTQLRELHGGLTELKDISWIARLPDLKVFDLFAEYVTDFSPLAKSGVDTLQIWDMRVPVDLKSLSSVVKLKELTLWDLKNATGFEALASLGNLQKLTLQEVNFKEGAPVDVSFAKGLGKLRELQMLSVNCVNTKGFEALAELQSLHGSSLNVEGGVPFDLGFVSKLRDLETLYIRDSNLANLEGLAGCSTLRVVSLVDVKGVTSLKPLKKLPALKSLTVTKGAFAEAELSGFGPEVRIELR